MIYIKSPSHDPYFNLALEEHLLTRCTGDEVFMLWRNERAVIVGKNQNTLAEIDAGYVNANGIAVVRRLTGGGAVFHDMGNLNFSYILNTADALFDNFRTLAGPIVGALASYGVAAEIGGRNDILIDGRKFSGNAQAVVNGRLLHHGTLLFHTDFDEMSNALTVNAEKIRGKGVKSVKGRVANICDYAGIDIDEFCEKIAEGLPQRELSPSDIAAAEKLKNEKYSTWEWNYGYSPKYNYHNTQKMPAGAVEVFIDVAGGIMRVVKFYGDFFAARDIADVEKALEGVRHDRASILGALGGIEIGEYFHGITAEEIAGAAAPQ